MQNIAIADDHSIFSQSLQQLLEQEPEFKVAGIGKKGLQLINIVSQTPIDLAIIDLRMPVMDGIAASKKLRTAYSGVKILILSMVEDTKSGEPDYGPKRRKEMTESLRNPFLATGLALIFILIVALQSSHNIFLNWHVGLLMLFKTAGLATSVLLLIQATNANSPLVQNFAGAIAALNNRYTQSRRII